MLDGVSIHFITILIYLKTVLLAALRMLVIVIFIVGIVIDTHSVACLIIYCILGLPNPL